MAEYDNTNSGALFKNNKKQTEKHPDYTGTINVGGQEFWISSWIKESAKGVKYMSLSVSPKEEQKTAPPAKPEPAPVDDDDSIPF